MFVGVGMSHWYQLRKVKQVAEKQWFFSDVDRIGRIVLPSWITYNVKSLPNSLFARHNWLQKLMNKKVSLIYTHSNVPGVEPGSS